MDIHTDGPSAAAIISGLAALLTFIYGVLKRSKTTDLMEEDVVEPSLDATTVNYRLDMLDKTIKDCATKADLSTLKNDSLANLERIEKRLEKMLEIIVNLKK